MTNIWNVMFDKKYDSFRKNLDYIYEDTYPNLDKQLLIKLMRDRGFRESKKLGRLEPKESQIYWAWEYLEKKYGKTEIDIIEYRTEKYKYFTIRRVMTKKGIIFGNKKYRKGQFLPNDIIEYRTFTIRRVMTKKSIIFRNKKYRKGQFLPNDIIEYRTEKYKYFTIRITIRRVMTKKGIIFRNKKYRKGQFLPKEFK